MKTAKYFGMIFTLLITIFYFFTSIALSAGNTSIPIPKQDDIVIWIRGDQIASDLELKTALSKSRAVDHYLGMLNLAFEQIDYAVLFVPFDKAWIHGSRQVLNDLLPPNGAFVVAGTFKAKDKFNGFKLKGWLKKNYSNKKLLWWSTGESYFCNPQGGECIGYLAGDRLVVSGSEQIMKDILDVAGNKQEGMVSTSISQSIGNDFFINKQIVISAFANFTDQMRNSIKADTINIHSSTAINALEYIDHLKEVGFSASRIGNGVLLKGNLGMDSQNNALVVASLLQIGGGLANLLPQGDPNREILSSMVVSRQERVVNIQADLTRQHFLNLIK